jgi:hypothetical protein
MNRTKPALIAGTRLAAVLVVPAVACAGEDAATKPVPERWTVLAAPYLWAAWLDGHAEVAGIKADVDVSFQDTLENLSFAGMAVVEARKGRFGFGFNPLFVRTNADARSGPLDAKITTDIATAGAGYRALYWDYKDGGFAWNVTMSGPMIGAGVRL